MATTPNKHTGSEIVVGLSAPLVGGGILTLALAPLAVPIIALTAIALLPLLVPVLALALLAALVAAPILLVRGLRRLRRGRGWRAVSAPIPPGTAQPGRP